MDALQADNSDFSYALVTVNANQAEITYTQTTLNSVEAALNYATATVDANTADITYVSTTADANLAAISYTQTTVNATDTSLTYALVTVNANTADITYTQVTVDANLANIAYTQTTLNTLEAGLGYVTSTVDANLADLTYTKVTVDANLTNLTYALATIDANEATINALEASVSAMEGTTNLFVEQDSTTLNFQSNIVQLGTGQDNIILAFGEQDLGENNERAAFIKRIDVNDVQIHSYKAMYLTTGYQKVSGTGSFHRHVDALQNVIDSTPSGAPSNKGIFINNGAVNDDDTWGNALNPVADASNKVKRDDYAFTMEHVKSDEADFDLDGVLRLSLEGESISDDNNYIAFTGNDNSLVGSISGHDNTVMGIAQTGVKLESIGADYAEYLPLMDIKEDINGGDIVGVYEGKITLNTASANRVMVVSTMPVVLGNWRGKNTKKIARPVAFVGQVPVKVRGKVNSGDYIVPSGQHDGYGVPVSQSDLQAHHVGQIIGQAWSSSTEEESIINVAITPLDQPNSVLKQLQSDNKELRSELDHLKSELNSIKEALKN